MISEIRRRHEGFTATLEKGLNELRGSFSDYRHPFIRESVLAEVDALEDRLVQALLSSWSIEKLNDRAQSVRKQIEELYEDSMIGAPFSEEELSAICSEGERRYKNEIPPGFKDARKTGDPRRPYGDLILWNEVLRKAKESGRPIILVTDDAKEDWWFRVSGETMGPLPALRREMLKEAGQRFHLYTSEQFLKHGARTFLKREADSQALQDVERRAIITKADAQLTVRLEISSNTKLGKFLSANALNAVAPCAGEPARVAWLPAGRGWQRRLVN
ncbi:MAG TPA: PIN-like domain-containing protein [Candidatus Acidoferrales bacterium]|nr:PIN-like domain-containing protein [Candidatus Acidoferrales bacterium]